MSQRANESGGGGKIFYVLGGAIVLAGVAWLVMARGGGIGSTAGLPTPVEFESIYQTIEADPASGIALGSPDAPIEIMEFADFSCPHCANFSGFAGKLLRQNYVESGAGGGPVRWVAYDYVLGQFPNTIPAAMAARCAGDQGRYWPVHDLLFSRQTRWYTAGNPGGEFETIMEQVGLDMGAYRSCMSEGRHLEAIAAARKYGEQLGVSSTPTLFVNGERLDLTGVEPYSYIEGIIKAKLAAGSETEDGADGGE